VDGRIQLRVLVDRGSVEVFANGGAMAMSVGVLVPEENRSIALVHPGGSLA
jgi:sucrose-6-phosphate hydrolase SacC (GH32 family)